MFMNLVVPIDSVPILFLSIFFVILFLQSGLDKLFSFQDNLNYFKNHFKNTVIRGVKFLLIILLVLECVTAFLFLLGALSIFLKLELTFQGLSYFFWGLVFSGITLCCLFLGQRLAQDYQGAVNLTTYFLLTLLGFLLVL